jgi:hypothetical protein
MTASPVPMHRWGRREQTIAAAVAGIAVGVLAGALAGRSLAPQESPAATRVVRAGEARLLVPADWNPATLGSSGVVGLDARSAVAMEPLRGVPARMIAVLAPADHPSLIPRALRELFAAPPPRPRAGRLAGWPAWHYPPRAARLRDSTVEVTVTPTTRGVLAVACVSPVAVIAAGCTSAVQGASVVGAAPLVPSRSVALAFRLSAALRRLDRARVDDRAALERARSQAAQAAAARRLANAYSVAVKAVRERAGGGAASLVERLATAGRAYAHLSVAARDGSIVRFDAARREVNAAEAGVASAVGQVRRRALVRVARRAGVSPTEPLAGSDSPTSNSRLPLVLLGIGAVTVLVLLLARRPLYG